ncbi:MAG: hypothetical protein ACTHMH_03915, partial [Curtobacterium sp.]
MSRSRVRRYPSSSTSPRANRRSSSRRASSDRLGPCAYTGGVPDTGWVSLGGRPATTMATTAA